MKIKFVCSAKDHAKKRRDLKKTTVKYPSNKKGWRLMRGGLLIKGNSVGLWVTS